MVPANRTGIFVGRAPSPAAGPRHPIARTSTLLRWMRFNAVSAAGVCVQLSLLWLLLRLNGGDHLQGTVLAVEAAVLHNFYWHWRWTWADRARGPVFWALARFQVTNGIIPVIGNLIGMYWLVDRAGLPPVPANVISICGCYLANYFAADRFVFPRSTTAHATTFCGVPSANFQTFSIDSRSPASSVSGVTPAE